MVRSSSALLLALVLVACDGTDTTADSGTPGSDAGTDGGLRTDSGPRPDSGGGPTDDCATDDAISTVGCNGWISGDPAPNTAFGSCTPGDDANPAGSCTTPNTVCGAAEGATVGQCIPVCTQVGTYVSTGECPMGSRCFDLTDYAICFRDCDATHPCATGEECDAEGSCVPAAAPPVDGGTVPADGGTVPADGGSVLPDASIDVDAGLPDAAVAG